MHANFPRTPFAAALVALLWVSQPALAAHGELKIVFPEPVTTNEVQFGIGVALSGDTALIGSAGATVAGLAQGAAYVYVRSGNTWTAQARLVADDGASGDLFGEAVALDGDTAVIGAPYDSVGGQSFQGSVYVYVRSGGGWTQQVRLSPPDGRAADGFGFSVALRGDTLVAGAPSAAPTTNGAAYVYTRTGGVWSLQQKLTATDPGTDRRLGVSVALDGDTAVAGAYQDSVAGTFRQGSAYVFVRVGASWAQQAKLIADDGAASDYFGTAVAVDADSVIVGAPWRAVDGVSNHGASYVFARTGTTWSQQARLTVPLAANGAFSGLSVTIAGDTALVGARSESVLTQFEGAAHVFRRHGTTWIRQLRLSATDGLPFDAYGQTVALAGDTALVGAFAEEAVGAPIERNTGAVYFYTVPPEGTDLQLSISNGRDRLVPGQVVTYDVRLLNAGPLAATAAHFSNVVPAGISAVAWTCSTLAGAASCPAASGSGNNIAQDVDLPIGGGLRFLVTGTVNAAVGATVQNSASVDLPAPQVDINAANNQAVDSDPVVTDALLRDGFEGGTR